MKDLGAKQNPVPTDSKPNGMKQEGGKTIESSNLPFTWRNVNYFVPTKSKEKLQLLENVSGYVVPGTMTALMGSSGAGKSTLLDVLAQRKTIGTIDGEIFYGGEKQGKGFKRITGYCEQQDVHNPNTTVREALRFSAHLRQPDDISIAEKDAYVEEIIDLLEMDDIADALVGDSDSGLGISLEERKRLTIGVELVAKPKILFLDEPTSGLDAQASYTIIRLLTTLAARGQAILCTIHQPSAILFESFSNILLLGRGGQTIYMSPIGPSSSTLLGYLERNGAPPCAPDLNPAEYMLNVIGAGMSSVGAVDWAEVWEESPERQQVQAKITDLRSKAAVDEEQSSNKEYTASSSVQRNEVFKRMFRSYWRMPG